MRSQNIKYKTSSSGKIGGISCLLLLLLTFLTINPITSLSAFAEEENEDSENYDIDAQALTASTVNIAFSPVAGTAVAPIGVPTKFQVTATVDVKNSGGYTIYFGSNSQNLTRVGGTETIAPIAGSVDFDNLENDTWGYALAEGVTVPDTATYVAVPGSVKGRAVYTNNSTKILSDSKTYTLSFAARIGTSKPAGTYQNEVTMSVVSSPAQLALSDISEMQQMTSDICENTAPNATKQLKDARDGKYYWVSKLADGKCWMTQNLDLDLGSEWPDVSLSDYEVASTEYKPTVTQTQQTADTADASQTNTRSWDFGEWVIKNPSVASNCGTKQEDLASCTAQFVNVASKTSSTNQTFYKDNGNKTVVDNTYDAHYLVGNYYSWNTATAGTGGTITTGEAPGSICPKGWMLPTSNTTAPGSFAGLIDAGSIGTDVAKLTGDGYFFVRGGIIYQNADTLFSYAGGVGFYWSSTPHLHGTHAYNLYLSTSSITLSDLVNANRFNGLSVRCIAR